MKSKSAAQLLAEKNLGVEKAAQLHKALYNGEVVTIPMKHRDSSKRATSLGWGKFYGYSHGEVVPIGSVPSRYRNPHLHCFTSYRQLWHIELWDPIAWCADDKEFLWMTLSMLTIDDLFSIADIAAAGCLSFMPANLGTTIND